MAKLPNADRAIVPERKITAYLLCHTHPNGGPKAVFFERFGFRSTEWERLRDALLVHARNHEVDRSFPTRFGTMYEVAGPLTSPDGRNPSVLVAWIIWHGEDVPRLVTAVPA